MMANDLITANTVGVVLAGGLSRRMGGGDKPLKQLAGKPMLAHAIDRLSPQVGSVVLNANGDPTRFSAFGLPVAADTIDGFAGPLAGVLAGMAWVSTNKPEASHILTVAGDTPFFPRDLAERFHAAVQGDIGAIVLAESGGYPHPVFGLWPVALADDLLQFLSEEQSKKVLHWVDRHPNHRCVFDEIDINGERLDPFFNVNTPEELSFAETLASHLASKAA